MYSLFGDFFLIFGRRANNDTKPDVVNIVYPRIAHVCL